MLSTKGLPVKIYLEKRPKLNKVVKRNSLSTWFFHHFFQRFGSCFFAYCQGTIAPCYNTTVRADRSKGMFCGLDLLYIMKLSLDHLTWAVGWPQKNQNNMGTSSTPVETLLATVTFFNYWFQPLNLGVRYKCRFQEYIQHYKAHKSFSLSWRWFILTNHAQRGDVGKRRWER